MRYTFATLFSILFFFSNAELVLAEVRCPVRIKETNPITKQTWDKVSLNRKIKIRRNNDLYEIPIGYTSERSFSINPTEEYLGVNPAKPSLTEVNDRKSISFFFWMPSKRYVERSMAYIPSFQPCENGRPKPKENEYVVKARVYGIYEDENGELLTPSKQHGNSMRYMKKTHDAEQVYGLTQYKRKKKIKVDLTRYYYNSEVFQAFFNCFKQRGQSHSPLCYGKFYFPENKYEMLHISFSRKNIGSWKDIAYTAKQLLEKWKVKN